MSTQFARHNNSWSSTPETPPGASMMSCFVSAGTYMPRLRSLPNFSGAAFEPWILPSDALRCFSQCRLDPCGS
jgi:hypothetical protein